MEMNEELLAKLEKSNRQQALFTKILCALCSAVLICSLVMTLSVTGVASQLMEVVVPLQNVASQVQEVATQVYDMTGQAETIMDNMETVTQALADADLGTMVENGESVDSLTGHVGQINHVHISEPNLLPIQRRSLHAELAALLREEGYTGFVSIEMKNCGELASVLDAMDYAKELFA